MYKTISSEVFRCNNMGLIRGTYQRVFRYNKNKGGRSHSAAMYFICLFFFVPLRCGLGARGYPCTETRSPLLPPFTPGRCLSGLSL